MSDAEVLTCRIRLSAALAEADRQQKRTGESVPELAENERESAVNDAGVPE